jgi:hypothetical protein
LEKAVSVRFFRITRGVHQSTPFFERLVQLNDRPEVDRIQQIAEVPHWIDKVKRNGEIISGRLCRIQSNNLPPQASEDGKLLPLGVRAIGPNTVWQFNGNLGVLAFEMTRNGVSLSKFLTYIRGMCNCRGYAYFPVLDDNTLEAARAGRVRELSLRVATPSNLHTIARDQQRMRAGMVELMGDEIATQMEIRYSVRARDPDIQEGWFTRTVNWLRQEKAADRGNISKLQARIVDEGGHSDVLDLLDAQLGMRRDLDLPDDDPDRHADIRLNNIADIFDSFLPSLERQFSLDSVVL